MPQHITPSHTARHSGRGETAAAQKRQTTGDGREPTPPRLVERTVSQQAERGGAECRAGQNGREQDREGAEEGQRAQPVSKQSGAGQSGAGQQPGAR